MKEQRKLIFGRNEIDIEGKSTTSLLVDEVSVDFSEDIISVYSDICSGNSPFLRLSNRQYSAMVLG